LGLCRHRNRNRKAPGSLLWTCCNIELNVAIRTVENFNSTNSAVSETKLLERPMLRTISVQQSKYEKRRNCRSSSHAGTTEDNLSFHDMKQTFSTQFSPVKLHSEIIRHAFNNFVFFLFKTRSGTFYRGFHNMKIMKIRFHFLTRKEKKVLTPIGCKMKRKTELHSPFFHETRIRITTSLKMD
jgi:hypothetical protein